MACSRHCRGIASGGCSRRKCRARCTCCPRSEITRSSSSSCSPPRQRWSALLGDLVTPPARVEKTDAKRPSWLANLASVPEADRAGVLKPWLEGVIREVMGGKVSGPLQARQPLRDLGMDSLMAVELRNHIAATTNFALPMSALFEHPSLDDLCRYIARQWALEGGVTSAPRRSPQAAGDAAEPIAIVGAACRFPGRVATLDDLWQLLETSTD